MNATTERIRALNDELRRNLPSGHAVMTAGIAALGPEAVARIVKTIAVYDDFCHANDPHQEHDFGSFEADGHTIFFKIASARSTAEKSSRNSREIEICRGSIYLFYSWSISLIAFFRTVSSISLPFVSSIHAV